MLAGGAGRAAASWAEGAGDRAGPVAREEGEGGVGRLEAGSGWISRVWVR